MYDVIVVGARCAGAPTAMLFARKGYRVLLLDRAKLPADTLSTLYIQLPGVGRLARWGLLDNVVDTGCPPLDRVVYEMAGVQVAGCATGVDGVTASYAPRRFLLDQVLADGAVAAGVELRDRCGIEELLFEDDRVVGVTCAEPGGGRFTERAHLVVGADGMRSTVANLVQAPFQRQDPRLTCAYYGFWQGPRTDFELYEGDTGWISAVPTNDAVLISAYFPQERFDEVRADAERFYLTAIRQNAPRLFEMLADAERVERLRGTGDQQNFFRQAGGPGWALVGDAGHHKDSLTARGIGDAFLQAELLVEQVGERLHEPAAVDEAVSTYGAQRDAELMGPYQATLLVAQADARDRRRALLAAVSTDPDLTQRYFDTVAGVRPVQELYTPELMAALNASAGV